MPQNTPSFRTKTKQLMKNAEIIYIHLYKDTCTKKTSLLALFSHFHENNRNVLTPYHF